MMMMDTRGNILGALSCLLVCCHASWTVTAFTTTTTTTTTSRYNSAPVVPTIPFHRPTFGVTPVVRIATTTARRSAEGDEDVEGGPLSQGVDSVQWLPTVQDAPNDDGLSSAPEGSTVLPLFPLGGIVYTPNSEHTLNIFEPRYRKMYNDILMNGSKRFVVSMSHPTEQGRFAKVGVLFELEDLKEVSEQTNDQVKFVCKHRVTGRVNLHRILNPSVWESRESYLKVEGTLMDVDLAGTDAKKEIMDETAAAEDDDGPTADEAPLKYEPSAPLEEATLRTSFNDLVEMQHDLEEDVRFTRASVTTLAVSPGDVDEGLWTTIRLWQSYSEQRLVARQNELQREFQDKLLKFLTKEKGVKEEELPSAIGFTDLSPDLQKEVQALQKRMSVELEPLVLESTLTMQKILEARDHRERVNLVRFFVDAERKRLEARKVLQGMFKEESDDDDSSSIADTISTMEAQLEEDVSSGATAIEETRTGSIFADDEDAFQ